MAYRCDTKFFKTGTGVAGTTIDVALSLGGTTPQFFECWMVGRVDTVGTDAVSARDLTVSYGFGMDATHRYAMGFHSRNATGGNSNSGSTLINTGIVQELSNVSVLVGRLDVNSVSADAIQFIVDVQFGADYLVLVFAESGWSNVTVWDSTFPTTTGIAANTNPGFIPDEVGLMCNFVGAGALPQTNTASCRPGIGRALPAGPDNQCLSWVILDNVATSDSASYCNDVECLAGMSVTSGAFWRGAVTGTTAGGFNFNIIETNGTGYRYAGYAKAGGVRVEVGTLDSIPPPDTNLGISPLFDVIGGTFWSACRTETAADTPTASAEGSIGHFTMPQATGKSLAQAFRDQDAVAANTNCNSASFNDNCYGNVTDAAAVEGAFGIDPLHSENPAESFFRVDPDDPSANFTMWIVRGNSSAQPAGSAWPPRGYRHRAHRRRRIA